MVGKWKYMRSSSTWEHLYDVVQDPAETDNHAGKALIAQRMCEVHMGEGLAVPDKSKRHQNVAVRRRLKAGQAEISPEMRRQLEALGYFGDNAVQDEPEDNE